RCPAVPPTSSAQQCTHLCPAVPHTCATQQCHPPVTTSVTNLLPSVPPTCAHQCHPPVPIISANYQCHLSVPPICATSLVLPIRALLCCLSVPISAAYQCPSVLLHQCTSVKEKNYLFEKFYNRNKETFFK
ncbi:unnamed protein product, partial [Staurois parvus]